MYVYRIPTWYLWRGKDLSRAYVYVYSRRVQYVIICIYYTSVCVCVYRVSH